MLGAPQRSVSIDPTDQPTCDAAAIDDRDRITIDAIPGVAVNSSDYRVKIGEHLQCAIAQHVAAGAGLNHGLHEGSVDDSLVAARDADGDRLCLVLDRVDRARELLDHLGQCRDEVIDQSAG